MKFHREGKKIVLIAYFLLSIPPLLSFASAAPSWLTVILIVLSVIVLSYQSIYFIWYDH